ncbi:MAG: hypothetical protein H6826_14470 [Planctomycetes bacterium]|nr:hypothetical protein [Planctomycetota bacterium]
MNRPDPNPFQELFPPEGTPYRSWLRAEPAAAQHFTPGDRSTLRDLDRNIGLSGPLHAAFAQMELAVLRRVWVAVLADRLYRDPPPTRGELVRAAMVVSRRLFGQRICREIAGEPEPIRSGPPRSLLRTEIESMQPGDTLEFPRPQYTRGAVNNACLQARRGGVAVMMRTFPDRFVVYRPGGGKEPPLWWRTGDRRGSRRGACRGKRGELRGRLSGIRPGRTVRIPVGFCGVKSMQSSLSRLRAEGSIPVAVRCMTLDNGGYLIGFPDDLERASKRRPGRTTAPGARR